MAPKTRRKLGYEATRDEDGTLVVHRVPIFVECERNEINFDGAWITEAVAKAKAQAAEGYFPPLHIRHHDLGLGGGKDETVRPAGFFQIVGTKQITFKGKRKTAVLADLHITNPAAQMEVLEKRLPYRSVEIFNVDTPSIDSLALLDHEAPYLELPMLMVSDVAEPGDDPYQVAPPLNENSNNGGPRVADTVVPGGGGLARVAFATVPNPWKQQKSPGKAEDVLVCFQRGHAAHLVFAQEKAMDNETAVEEIVDETVEENTADETKQENFEGAPPFPPKEEGGEESPESASDEDKESETPPVLDTQSIVQAIADGSISVADMDAICAAVEQRKAQVEGQQPQNPMQPQQTQPQAMPAPAAVPGGEAMSANEEKKSVSMAALEGKLAALEAKDAERDARDQRTQAVSVAMQRLAGRPLGADLEERLVHYHEKHGAEAFEAHVEAIVTTFGALPDTGDDRMSAFMGQSGSAPATAMRFSAHGTDAVEQAAEFASQWKELSSHGATSMSEDRYVEINMAGRGVVLTAKES